MTNSWLDHRTDVIFPKNIRISVLGYQPGLQAVDMLFNSIAHGHYLNPKHSFTHGNYKGIIRSHSP